MSEQGPQYEHAMSVLACSESLRLCFPSKVRPAPSPLLLQTAVRCLLCYFSRQSQAEGAHTQAVFQRDCEMFNSQLDVSIWLVELFAKHLVKHYFLVHLWDVSEEISIWFSGLSQCHPCRVGSHQPISWGPEKKAEEGQIHSALLSGTSVFSCPDFPDLKLADSRSWHLSASINVWVNCYNNSLISIYPIGSVSLGTLTIQVVSVYFQHSMAWKSTTAPPPHTPPSHNKW